MPLGKVSKLWRSKDGEGSGLGFVSRLGGHVERSTYVPKSEMVAARGPPPGHRIRPRSRPPRTRHISGLFATTNAIAVPARSRQPHCRQRTRVRYRLLVLHIKQPAATHHQRRVVFPRGDSPTSAHTGFVLAPCAKSQKLRVDGCETRRDRGINGIFGLGWNDAAARWVSGRTRCHASAPPRNASRGWRRCQIWPGPWELCGLCQARGWIPRIGLGFAFRSLFFRAAPCSMSVRTGASRAAECSMLRRASAPRVRTVNEGLRCGDVSRADGVSKSRESEMSK